MRNVDLCSTRIEQTGKLFLVIPTLSVIVKEQEGLGLGGCRRQRPHCDSFGSCKSEKLNMQLPRAEAVSSHSHVHACIILLHARGYNNE